MDSANETPSNDEDAFHRPRPPPIGRRGRRRRRRRRRRFLDEQAPQNDEKWLREEKL